MLRRFPRAASSVIVLLSTALPLLAIDFQVTMASYLGGSAANDVFYAVDVGLDRSIVAGGVLRTSATGAAISTIFVGGDGAVVRLSPEGTALLSVARMGSYVSDLEVGPDGTIAVVGSFGVVLLDSLARSARWRDTTLVKAYVNFGTPQARVAVGIDGTVACMVVPERYKAYVYVYRRDGTRIFDTVYTDKYPGDICVDGVNKRFIIGGFNTLSAPSVHLPDHPIHMPYIRAYSYTGTLAWTNYQFTAPEVYAMNTFADSRVERLVFGRDGNLYMGGYIHGGDHVYRHDPHDVTKMNAPQAGFDAFSTPYAMSGGANYSYYAKFIPSSGDYVTGEALLCRETETGSGKSKEIAIRGLAADETGTVYISGWCSSFIANRSKLTVAGIPVGAYWAKEPYVLIVAPNFKSRTAWTVFSKERCAGTMWAVSARNGDAVVVGQIDSGSAITTPGALQPSARTLSESYFVSFKPPALGANRGEHNATGMRAPRKAGRTPHGVLLDGRLSKAETPHFVAPNRTAIRSPIVGRRAH